MRTASFAQEPSSLERAALITIDMQNDFVTAGGSSIVSGSAAILPPLARLLALWRGAMLPIIHAVRFYDRDGGNAELGRRAAIRDGAPIVLPGSPGAELVDAVRLPAMPKLDAAALMAGNLQPLATGEVAMYKPRWGAFYRTGLMTHLVELGIDTLVVCGCNLPNCPRATLFEASERDLITVIVADATSQASPARLADLELIDVKIASVAEIAEALRSKVSHASGRRC